MTRAGSSRGPVPNASETGELFAESVDDAIRDAVRAAGKTGFQTELSEAYPDGQRFLANRGFVETERNKMVRLDLAGLTPPEVQAPAGIRLTRSSKPA